MTPKKKDTVRWNVTLAAFPVNLKELVNAEIATNKKTKAGPRSVAKVIEAALHMRYASALADDKKEEERLVEEAVAGATDAGKKVAAKALGPTGVVSAESSSPPTSDESGEPSKKENGDHAAEDDLWGDL